MNRLVRKKILAFVIAAWMTLCVPASSNAFLTELVVGGAILAEIGGTVVATLPQLTIFVSSIVTLAKTSEAIADSAISILKFIFPRNKIKGKGNKVTESVQSSNDVKTGLTSGSTDSSDDLTGSTDKVAVGSGEISVSEPSGEVELAPDSQKMKEINKLVKFLIDKFPEQMAFLVQLTGTELNEGERKILSEGYSELVSSVSDTKESLVTIILDAVESGDSVTVDFFVAVLDKLKGSERVALVPVLSKIIEQGAAFNKLYSLPDEGLLASLTDIYIEYQG